MNSNEAVAIESLFHLQNKNGTKVPFNLNTAQRFFDNCDNPNGRKRIIVVKARQKGFSSIILGKFGIRCLGKEGTHAVCMSHESNATQRLLDKVHFYLNHMNGPKPNAGRNSRTELYFPKTESTYYIGTAGAKAFGRGDWITDLHCSEYAFWEDPLRHSAGLFQAVPQNGRIYIESTGNGRNNDFYYIWQHAEEMGYDRLFYPWFADTEYSLELPPNMLEWKPDTSRFNPYLLEIRNNHKLSDNQMYWYEMKLRELREDIRIMQQEYPTIPEESFQATGGTIFNNVELSTTLEWQAVNYQGHYAYKHFGHPRKEWNYVLGADPSGGTGNDDAALVIFCCETGEEVFELFNNTIAPFPYAQLVCDIGHEYNDAFIVPESNNHGAAVVPYIKTNYSSPRIYKRKLGTKSGPPSYGWMNSDTTKHALIGLMQEMMDQVTLYGMQTVKELKAFEETQEGKLSGKSDNLVIATGLAMLGLKRFEHLRKEYLRPVVITVKPKTNYMTYNLDDVLARLDKKNRKADMQVGEGYPNA